MKIWRFENFIELVNCGSISAAAQKLHISPQALHQQMDTLESEIGCTLLVRSRKGIALTAAGSVFYARISTLVEDYRCLIRQTLDADAKEQHIIYAARGALFTDHIFVDGLVAFRKQHPEIDVRRASPEQVKNNLCGTLANDQVYPTNLYDNYASVISNCFIHVQRTHPLANKKQVSLEDLFGTVLLVNTPDQIDQLPFPFWQKLQKNASQITIEALPFKGAADADTMVLSANHIYLCWGIQQNLHPELRQIPIKDSEFEYMMLYHKERYKESRSLQIYLKFMAQYYKNHWQTEYDRILGNQC